MALPTEIWDSIFQMTNASPLTLSLVCKAWRNIYKSSPKTLKLSMFKEYLVRGQDLRTALQSLPFTVKIDLRCDNSKAVIKTNDMLQRNNVYRINEVKNMLFINHCDLALIESYCSRTLKYLAIESSTKINTFYGLCDCELLETLDFRQMFKPVGETILNITALSELHNLKNLFIMLHPHFIVTIGDLAPLCNLINLQINSCASVITDESVLALRQNTKLRILSLNCKISDVGIEYIVEQFPQLYLLRLYSSNITDSGLISLIQGSPKLMRLGLFSDKITDAGLIAISKMPQVKRISHMRIMSTAITEVGIAEISKHIRFTNRNEFADGKPDPPD